MEGGSSPPVRGEGGGGSTRRRAGIVAYFSSGGSRERRRGTGGGGGNNKTETSRVIYKTEAAHFSGRGVYSSPRFEYSVRGTAIKSFDKRRRGVAAGVAVQAAHRAHTAMHRRAFSFASEKRMNVAPRRQTASTRRLHEYARPAVCAFYYSRRMTKIIHGSEEMLGPSVPLALARNAGQSARTFTDS